MFWKLKLFFYYFLIARLPHSRFCRLCRKIRLFYVCRILKIMEYHPDSFFENNVHIGTGRDLSIGRRCHINENAFLQSGRIGHDVMIAAGVSILSGLHNTDRTDIPMIEQGVTVKNPVVVEDDVWIGRNAILLPGIRVRKGSIITAGSVVSHDVKSYCLYGGVPAQFIRRRSGIENND